MSVHLRDPQTGDPLIWIGGDPDHPHVVDHEGPLSERRPLLHDALLLAAIWLLLLAAAVAGLSAGPG